MSPSRNDALLAWTLIGLTGLSSAIVVFIFGFVANESLPVLQPMIDSAKAPTTHRLSFTNDIPPHLFGERLLLRKPGLR